MHDADIIRAIPIATVRHGLAVHTAINRQQREAVAQFVVTRHGDDAVVFTADTAAQVAERLNRYAASIP